MPNVLHTVLTKFAAHQRSILSQLHLLWSVLHQFKWWGPPPRWPLTRLAALKLLNLFQCSFFFTQVFIFLWAKIFKLGRKMCIKKKIIVNIVCSVLVIITSQITTDARIKTLEDLIWCHFSAKEATMFLHPSTTAHPRPPFVLFLFVCLFLSRPMHRGFIW